MSRISLLRSARNRALLALALGGAATLVLPAIASAAESLYWSDFAVPEIRVASLGPGGSLAGSGPPQTLFAQPEATPPVEALGVAIDPAAGKIYWADAGSGTIEVANLNGSGSPQTLYEEPGGAAAYPAGVAIDPAAGKIYWSDAYSDKIEVANLNGNGSPQTLFELPEGGEPWGVAIDPAAGKIYWAEYLGGRIEVGNLNGSGSPETLVEEASAGPEALVVDPATRRIYWTNAVSEEIEMSGIAGGSPETLVVDGGEVPVGIALDPATGELYWSDVYGGEIASVNVDGEGAEAPLVEEAEGESPTFLALLSSPASTGTPAIAGGAGMIGETLSCDAGSWAGDEPEAAFYEAPESIAYQWLDDGAPIAGATSATWTVSESGSIACEVTATNAAGSASATSASVVVQPEAQCACGPPHQTGVPVFEEVSIAKPKVSIETIAKRVKSGKELVKLACGGATCTGTVTLTARAKVKKGRTETVTLAHASYSIAAGKRGKVTLKLMGEDRKLLAKLLAHAKKHRIAVKLKANAIGGNTATRSAKLRLAAAKKTKKKARP